MTPKTELVIDSKSVLGEGPIWDARNNRLLFVDIEKHLLFMYQPSSGSLKHIDIGQRVSAVVPKRDGNLLLALEKRISILNLDTQDLDIVLEVENDLPANRFNDGKCDPAGRFWIGTMAMDMSDGRANLYRVDQDLTIKRMLDEVTISNGLAWSLDSKKMYYIDTPTRKVDCFDYDNATGEICNRRSVIEIPETMGYPDGMTIDAKGQLWIALFGGGIVTCWNPDRGTLIKSYPIPAINVTACAFGGEDLDELYVTTAKFQMADEDSEIYPHAGSVFRLKPGFNGLPSFEFND
jgi:sugar lactone lactonase YvrE